MSWIKIEHTLPDKPEVFRIAEHLGIDPDAVVGKLIRFWTWCDLNTVDGNALGVTDSVIDRVTHQPGFAAALRKVDWLQARSGSLVVPRFDRHNGQTAKARALDNRRKAERREADRQSRTDGSRTNVQVETGQNPGPEEIRGDKSTEEGEEAPPPPNEDAVIPTASEVRAFGVGAGVPPDYCDRFHANTTEKRMWLNARGELTLWRKTLVRFWAKDRAMWGCNGTKGKSLPAPGELKGRV